jgi:hypothetical protein
MKKIGDREVWTTPLRFKTAAFAISAVLGARGGKLGFLPRCFVHFPS